MVSMAPSTQWENIVYLELNPSDPYGVHGPLPPVGEHAVEVGGAGCQEKAMGPHTLCP